MTVTVVKGAFKTDLDSGHKMEPYCKLAYNDFEGFTSWKKEGGLNVTWNNSFKIFISKSHEFRQLRVECRDNDNGGVAVEKQTSSHFALIGNLKIDTDQFYKLTKEVTQDLDIFKANGAHEGKVQFKFSYKK